MTLLPTIDRDVEPALPEKLHAIRNLLPRGFRAMGRRSAFLRRTMLQAPLISDWCDERYAARRARYVGSLAPVTTAQRTVLAELGTTGVAVRDAYLPAHVVASADRFVALLRDKDTDGPCVKATPRELADDPTLFTWGLSERLLDLAESHVGLPVRYLGVEVKRELVDSVGGSRHEVVRRWHLDHEDRRILKMIVYLSDVDADSGPFGYVALPNSGAVLGATGGRHLNGVSDYVMQTVVPRSDWRQVTGPRMTAVHVDTGQVFHRVFPPTRAERFSVTFAYASRNPYYAYSRLMLPRVALRQLRNQLSSRQWEALCVGRAKTSSKH